MSGATTRSANDVHVRGKTTVYPEKVSSHPVQTPSLLSNPLLTKEKLINTENLYRMSQEERAKLREGVPYVKLYRYNPKHLYPKLNGYGDNGQRSLKL